MPDAGDAGATAAAVEPVPPGGVFGGPRSLGIDAEAGVGGRSTSAPRIYLVASADAATEVLTRIVEENRLRLANGAPERDAKVVIVESDEQAIAYAGSLQDSDAIRVELGAPPFEIIDLRRAQARRPRPHAPAMG
jgi:hypothetical protein